MKKYIVLLLVIICAALLSGSALPEQISEQLDAAGAQELTDELSDETRALMRRLGIDKIDAASIINLSPADFFSLAFELARDAVRHPLSTLLVVTGIAVLCALLDSMKLSLGGQSLDTVFQTVSVVCIASAVISPIMRCISTTAEAIRECSLFLLSFVPVFSSVMVASGRPISAAGYQTLVFAAAQIISRISSETLVPLLGIYLALCLVGSISQVDITAIAKTVKTVINWSLGLMMTLFVGLLGLQSLVGSSADSLTLKTAKFLVGSFVPVVGGALSEALSTAQGCVSLVKTAIGVYGIIAAAMTFLPVLLTTAAWRLTVAAAAGICEMLSIKPIAKVLSASGTVLGILVSITLCFALLIIITTTIMLMVGGVA